MPTWISPLLIALLFTGSSYAQQELTYRVVAEFPHDKQAFTQGLLFHNGMLYESTGLYGRSEVREVELVSGRSLRKQRLSAREFGEGLALVEDQLIQLTWKKGHARRWQLSDFSPLASSPYRFAENRDGWGLCFDGQYLAFSDGTDQLHFLTPDNLQPIRSISVYDQRGLVSHLNELECINNRIYANIWLTDRIVIINPMSGEIEARVDLDNLYPHELRKHSTNVLNGIAWDAAGERLFITGKRWPKLFQIDLEPPGNTQ